MSRHACPSPHSHPTRLRSAMRPKPAPLPAKPNQRMLNPPPQVQHTPEPAGFNASRRPHSCRATRVHRRIPTPRISVAHAREARTTGAFSSQASQPAGFSASRNPRICRVTRVHRRILTPRASVGQCVQSPRRFL